MPDNPQDRQHREHIRLHSAYLDELELLSIDEAFKKYMSELLVHGYSIYKVPQKKKKRVLVRR